MAGFFNGLFQGHGVAGNTMLLFSLSCSGDTDRIKTWHFLNKL